MQGTGQNEPLCWAKWAGGPFCPENITSSSFLATHTHTHTHSHTHIYMYIQEAEKSCVCAMKDRITILILSLVPHASSSLTTWEAGRGRMVSMYRHRPWTKIPGTALFGLWQLSQLWPRLCKCCTTGQYLRNDKRKISNTCAEQCAYHIDEVSEG